MTDADFRPCPQCPDGYVWNSDGSTGKTCQLCKGYAVVNPDGSPLTKEQQEGKP